MKLERDSLPFGLDAADEPTISFSTVEGLGGVKIVQGDE
jgi:hypothetical protein